jgi:hypothetical protein
LHTEYGDLKEKTEKHEAIDLGEGKYQSSFPYIIKSNTSSPV